MSDVKQVLRQILEEAHSNEAELRWVRTCRPGDEIRQGDVYLYPTAAPADPGREVSSKQLAPGDTPGSRHIVEGSVLIYAPPAPGVLQGPLVHAQERFTLTHPEHAHISLPAGWYEVRYQRDFEEPEVVPPEPLSYGLGDRDDHAPIRFRHVPDVRRVYD